MIAKHTPGPWSKLPSGEAKFIPLRTHHCEKLGFCIGFVNYDINDGHGSIPAANARLIAAAPELLEFAEEVRKSGDTRLASMAVAAITKAIG